MIRDDGYAMEFWSGLGKNEAGTPVKAGTWIGIKTAQIIVNTADSDTIALQGSMDGTNWEALHALEFDTGEYIELTGISASMMITLVENPLFIRPQVSNAGGGGADFDVYLGANTRL